MLNTVDIEARTQELGLLLDARLRGYSPSGFDRLQERAMVLLMQDDSLRTSLLRFVDTYAALPPERFGYRAASLLREYLRKDFRSVPALLRMALVVSRSPIIPSPLIGLMARFGTGIIARKFITTTTSGGVRKALQQLGGKSRYPSFDLLGEAVLSEEEADTYRQSYLNLLTELSNHPLSAQRTPGDFPALEVSLKLSSLTSQFNAADPEGTLKRVRPALEEICLTAREHGIGINVDAEQYDHRELTWHIVKNMLAPGEPLSDWPDFGIVIQAYLKDAPLHAAEIVALGKERGVPMKVRLVKGAYWDEEVIEAEAAGWPVPVYRDKADTDIAFEGLVLSLLQEAGAVKLALASHNLRSHAHAEAVREAYGLPENAVEHQTLHGTLEGLSQALQQVGWVSRDYIPTGELIPGMAYLVRRVLENTSQVGVLTRSRTNENPATLLRQPMPSEEDASYQRLPYETGFANTPPPRLFEAEERERFQAALNSTRAEWGKRYPLFLGDDEVDTGQVSPSLSPSVPDPENPVGWVSLAGHDEAERAITAANAAAPAWAARPLAERVSIGLRAAELLHERKYEAAAWVVHEGGRSWPESLADVEEAIDHITWNARQLQWMEEQIQNTYRPRGVVACIPPWNFPMALPAGMTSAALLAGNAVILKSASPTPIVAQKLVDALHDAGVPRDVLIHLPGPGGVIGNILAASPAVDMVAFTGSKEVGVGIYREAAAVAPTKGGIKRVVAEMGGKNAIVVFPDADMDEAVQGIIRSAFSHAGQKCSACSRVLVHRSIHRRLAARLVEAARSLPVGAAHNPSTVINPVIDHSTRDRVLAYGAIARSEGRVLLDRLEEDWGVECCVGPLIVELEHAQGITARVAQDEMFAPILPLIPFDSEQEAVKLVNSTAYGMAVGIYSRTPSTVNRMLQACQTGNIYVNREIVGARLGIEPFGGFKMSGTGPKTGSQEYPLAFLTRVSSTRNSSLGTQDSGDEPAYSVDVHAWDKATSQERLKRLQTALERLRGTAPGGVYEAVAAVLAHAEEVTLPHPTVEVPGQTNYVDWTTPRGIGVIAVDDGASPAILASMAFGSLLAGNGVVVSVSQGHRPFAETLAKVLWQSGVPKNVLALALQGTTPQVLASGPVHFAAVDLAEQDVQAVYRVLGMTDEARGQQWLKALISMDDGPRPGEAGFLRMFAHPKTVSIRTLRHGADLKLI